MAIAPIYSYICNHVVMLLSTGEKVILNIKL